MVRLFGLAGFYALAWGEECDNPETSLLQVNNAAKKNRALSADCDWDCFRARYPEFSLLNDELASVIWTAHAGSLLCTCPPSFPLNCNVYCYRSNHELSELDNDDELVNHWQNNPDPNKDCTCNDEDGIITPTLPVNPHTVCDMGKVFTLDQVAENRLGTGGVLTFSNVLRDNGDEELMGVDLTVAAVGDGYVPASADNNGMNGDYLQISMMCAQTADFTFSLTKDGALFVLKEFVVSVYDVDQGGETDGSRVEGRETVKVCGTRAPIVGEPTTLVIENFASDDDCWAVKSGEFGNGRDNPTDSLEITDLQASRTADFAFHDKAEVMVEIGLTGCRKGRNLLFAFAPAVACYRAQREPEPDPLPQPIRTTPAFDPTTTSSTTTSSSTGTTTLTTVRTTSTTSTTVTTSTTSTTTTMTTTTIPCLPGWTRPTSTPICYMAGQGRCKDNERWIARTDSFEQCRDAAATDCMCAQPLYVSWEHGTNHNCYCMPDADAGCDEREEHSWLRTFVCRDPPQTLCTQSGNGKCRSDSIWIAKGVNLETCSAGAALNAGCAWPMQISWQSGNSRNCYCAGTRCAANQRDGQGWLTAYECDVPPEEPEEEEEDDDYPECDCKAPNPHKHDALRNGLDKTAHEGKVVCHLTRNDPYDRPCYSLWGAGAQRECDPDWHKCKLGNRLWRWTPNRR